MIRMLLALYPKEWRRTYGEEFAALLEQTHFTPRVVLDVLAQACKRRADAHPSGLRMGEAVLVSLAVEVVARAAGLTANILWPPTTPARAAALLVLFAPWVALFIWTRNKGASDRPERLSSKRP